MNQHVALQLLLRYKFLVAMLQRKSKLFIWNARFKGYSIIFYLAFEVPLSDVRFLVHDQIAGVTEGFLANLAFVWLHKKISKYKYEFEFNGFNVKVDSPVRQCA